MSVQAAYPSQSPYVDSMKPYISLEFFLSDVRVSPEKKPVTTLIRRVLGKDADPTEFPVNCVAVIETAAEKWVALTRRVATSTYREHYRDASLVRHLYDLHEINRAGYFNEQFKPLVADIVMSDRVQFKNHNSDYYKNPAKEIERAIDQLGKETIWREHWEKFLDSMVFSDRKGEF